MKKTLTIWTSIMLLTGLFLYACSPYRYHTTRIEELNFDNFKTYSWLPPVDSLSKSYFSGDIANHNILTAANKELESRGLVYTKDDPDLLFRYIVIVNNKSRPVYSYPSYYGMGPWGWYGGFYGYYPGNRPIGKEKYRYGHLIIQAIEKDTKRVVWQARGSTEVKVPETAVNNLPKMVEGVFKQYPTKR